MNLRFCVNPPLQTTTLLPPSNNLVVFVHLSLRDNSCSNEHLESYTVNLWSNLRDPRWSSLAALNYFEQTDSTCQDGSSFATSATFRADIDVGDVPAGTYEFTFRARSSPDAEWIWAGNGVEDNGTFRVLERLRNPPGSVDEVIEFCGHVVRSPVLGSKVIFVRVPETEESSGSKRRQLGRLKSNAIRQLFLERQSAYWLAPCTSSKESDITNRDIQMALYQLDDITFLLLVPFSMDGSSTAFIHQGSHQLFVRVPTRRVNSMAHLVVTIGSDPYELIAEAMSAIKHVKSSNIFGGLENFMPSCSRTVTKASGADRKPGCTKSLGWCTWNTFYESVSLEGILCALDSFKRSGIYLGWIMIDDGWQHVGANRQLIGLEADPVKFPGGLKHALKVIRQRHPSIQTIGVWHTVLGYWNGISHTSPLTKEYDILKMTSTDNSSVCIVSKKDVGRFYSNFYKLLSSAGVGMVKVDHQAVFENLNSSDCPNPWQDYQAALAENAERYFKGNVIYCMAHSPDVLFNKLEHNHVDMALCPTGFEGASQPKPLLRNSDDFFPDQPGSHSWHIFSNAVNAYFMANLKWAVLDWDMFQSKHTRSHFHAVARAICGGLVYISDAVDCHDSSLVDRLLADDISDARSILCCDQPARVPVDSLFVDPTKTNTLLKLSNVNAGRWAVLAVFNCRDQTDILGSISLDDIPFPLTRICEDTGDQVYVVYDFENSGTRRLSGPKGSLRDRLTVLIPAQGVNLFTFAPLDRVSSPNGTGLGIACFGLIDKYNGSNAILQTCLKIFEPSDGSSFFVDYIAKLKHRGRLGIWLDLGSVNRDIPRGTVPKAVKMVEVNRVVLGMSALSYDYGTDVLCVDMFDIAEDMGMECPWMVRVTILIGG